MTRPDHLVFTHHEHDQAAELRQTLLDVYAEVYAAELDDPFTGVERFARGLDGWSGRPGWFCTLAHDGKGGPVIGYAYGAPLPKDAAWWKGLLSPVPDDQITEDGTRTYALSELMIRAPWRGTGTARRLHDAHLAQRPEQRATLLVEQDHPKVRALYESWDWHKLGDLRPRFPDAPLFDAMLLPLN